MTFGDADFAGFEEAPRSHESDGAAQQENDLAETASPDIEHRLHGLVAYHTSRANKLEAENTTLKVELANVKFDLEHTKLELRQMASKRDTLQKDLNESLKSKTVLAQDLGIENSEMISTIDKLETERDVLLEQIEKLREWIVANKGEKDVICNAKNDHTTNTDGSDPVSGEEKNTWVDSVLNSTPTPLAKRRFIPPNKNVIKDDEINSSKTTMFACSDDTSDKLYSDDYINEAGEDDEEEDDDDFFGKSYHGNKTPTKTNADKCAAQNDSNSDTSSTLSSESEESGTTKKQKRRVFGVSVRPRHVSKAPRSPKSPKCVSTPIYSI